MKWRLIGPFRGGRVVAVTGVPGNPTKFYFGAVNGGIWETTDAGVVWQPIFDELGLPYVSLHSARHSFISTLQAQGVEVGLVAKLAGHANPAVTLGHYTQAVRGGSEALEALQHAYS